MTDSLRFQSRVLRLAKDVEHPEQDQDAFRADPGRGVAVIADGVASGIFSRLWAGILTEAVLFDMPNLDDPEAFARWLTLRREAWAAEINVSRLAWHQKPKLRSGAFSTLLWVCLLPDAGSGEPGAGRLRAFAVGDSCLFHVRQGELLRSFPVQRAAELEADPLVIGSVDLNRDQLLKFHSLDESCRSGDLLVLCTDAVAAWALGLYESGQTPAWQAYWDMTDEAWREEVTGLREQQQMRVDDATLALLRVSAHGAAAEPLRGVEADGAQPPPLPSTAGEQAWEEKFRSLSEQVAGGLRQGLRKLKDLSGSAGSAIRKYCEKFRS